MSSPIERYRRDLESPAFAHDAAQAQAVDCLQRLYEDLVAAPPPRQLRHLGDSLRGLIEISPKRGQSSHDRKAVLHTVLPRDIETI